MNNNTINSMFFIKASVINCLTFTAYYKKFIKYLMEAGFPAEVEDNINSKYFAKYLFHKNFTEAVKNCFGLQVKCEWNIKTVKLEWEAGFVNGDNSNMNLTLPKLLKYLTAPAYGLNISKKDIEALPLTKEVKSPLPADKIKAFDNIILLKDYFAEIASSSKAIIEALPAAEKSEAEAVRGFYYEYYLNGILHKATINAEAVIMEAEAVNKALKASEAPKPKKAVKKAVKSPAPKGKASAKKAPKK